MSLNDVLQGKILRPIDAPNVGIYVKKIEPWPQDNSFMLSVRYFSLKSSGDGMSEDIHLLTLGTIDFLSRYEICINADEIKDFDDAKWILIEEFVANWLEE